LLVFIGLIVAAGLLVGFGLLYNVFFPQRLGDLPFLQQFLFLAVIYFFIYPAIMVLITNVYFKTNGKKTWGNWLKIALNYKSVFTVIAVYQCAFVVIEVLVFCTSNNASYTFEKVIMFTVPFIMFFLSRDIAKKLFGSAEIEGLEETGDEDVIDPNDFTIRQPVYALVIYIVISAFFLLLYLAALAGSVDRKEDILSAAGFYFLCMSPFLLFGPFLIFLRSRWKIIIKGNQISSTTYFGRTKTCTFSDITRVKQHVGSGKVGKIFSLTAYHEKKRLFALTDHCPGYKEFVQRLKDEGVKIDW